MKLLFCFLISCSIVGGMVGVAALGVLYPRILAIVLFSAQIIYMTAVFYLENKWRNEEKKRRAPKSTKDNVYYL